MVLDNVLSVRIIVIKWWIIFGVLQPPRQEFSSYHSFTSVFTRLHSFTLVSPFSVNRVVWIIMRTLKYVRKTQRKIRTENNRLVFGKIKVENSKCWIFIGLESFLLDIVFLGEKIFITYLHLLSVFPVIRTSLPSSPKQRYRPQADGK